MGKIRLVLAIFTFLFVCPALCASELIRSGYVEMANFGVKDKQGKLLPLQMTEQIWFDGKRTLHKTWHDGRLSSIDYRGPHEAWSVCPDAHRITDYGDTLPADKTYSEQVREAAAFWAQKAKPVGQGVVRGQSCLRLFWHENAQTLGCLPTPASDNTLWISDDPQFPLVWHSGPDPAQGTGIRVVRLNCAVPPSVFDKPTGMHVTRPFHMPEGRFLVEIKSVRVLQHGWKSEETETFTGDGVAVVQRFWAVHTEKDGEQDTFNPPDKLLNYTQATLELQNRLQSPEWSSQKETGNDMLLGRPVQKSESHVKDCLDEQWWTAEDPVWGTINLRRITGYPGDVTDQRVTRLELSPTSLRRDP